MTQSSTVKLFAAAVLLAAFAAGAAAQDWQSVVKKYGPAVGKVEIKDGAALMGSGSCFLIDENGRILTNAHVVKDAKFNAGTRIIVTFPYSAEPTKEYPATIQMIATETDLDLAVLKVEGRFSAYCSLSAGEEPAIMSEVLVMGYPLGKGFKSTPGFLQAYQDIEGVGHMLDLSASVDFGNSGGPVFGKDGSVVGIVTAKIFGFNFNLALPIRNASDFLAGQEKVVKVSVTTEPAGARIFLNGIYRGASPLSIELFPRAYSLLVEKDGWKSVEKTVTFAGGAKPEINVTMEAASDPTAVKLAIKSDPPGARVTIDNVERGTSPVEIDAVKGTRLRIKMFLSGYKDFYVEVTLGADDRQELSYTLQKAGLFW